MRSILLAAALVVTMAVPANGHQWHELNEWLDGWYQRFSVAFGYATGRVPATIEQQQMLSAVIAEMDEMMSRHPGWDGTYQDEPPPRPKRATFRWSGTPGVEQWRGLVSAYFPPEDVERVLCLMQIESGGDPTARNPSSSATGLMQVMYSLWGPPFGLTSRAQLEDPDTNLRIAAYIRKVQGWTAWSPYNKGSCR